MKKKPAAPAADSQPAKRGASTISTALVPVEVPELPDKRRRSLIMQLAAESQNQGHCPLSLRRARLEEQKQRFSSKAAIADSQALPEPEDRISLAIGIAGQTCSASASSVSMRRTPQGKIQLIFESQTGGASFEAIVEACKEAEKKALQTAKSSQSQGAPLTTSENPRCLEMALPQVDGKKPPGTLQAHKTGLRFVSQSTENVSADPPFDILYSSIDFACSQQGRSDGMLLYLHLKKPLEISGKNLPGLLFSRSGDMPKGSKTDIFQEFKSFCEHIASLSKLSLQHVEEEQKFQGIPKGTGRVCPSRPQLSLCKQALLCLDLKPALCLQLSDIDVIIMEPSKLLNPKLFELVVIFKDFGKHPVRIEDVSINDSERIHTWLSETETVWYNIATNHKWQGIVQQIIRNPTDFLDRGGWDGALDVVEESGQMVPISVEPDFDKSGDIEDAGQEDDDEEEEEDSESDSFESSSEEPPHKRLRRAKASK